MLMSKNWLRSSALIAVVGFISVAVSPLMAMKSASAQVNETIIGQLFSSKQSKQFARVSAGTIIPIRYEEADKIIVTPDETASFTLTVAADILDSSGRLAIPLGSLIEGEMQPSGRGTQFVARDLILYNSEERLLIDADSAVISNTRTITRRSNPDILRGAAIGAAAAGVLSEIFGDLDWYEVLAGAGVGILAELLIRGDEEVEVVVIDPDRDLDLKLQSDLFVD